jgi:hypothetical protein
MHLDNLYTLGASFHTAWANSDRSETRTISCGVFSEHIGSMLFVTKIAAPQENRSCFPLLVTAFSRTAPVGR